MSHCYVYLDIFPVSHADLTIQPDVDTKHRFLIHSVCVMSLTESWQCSSGPGGVAVPEGQSLNLTATLSYHGGVQPPVTWYEDGQQLEAQTVVMHDFNQNVLT